MAKSASATDIFSYDHADEPLPHGGDVSAARRLFPDAPEPFIDLSTGINPNPYPLRRLPAEVFARLPDGAAVDNLTAAAARRYGAPSAACVVPAPGTQILLPLVAGLVRPGRAAIVVPTYGEHGRAAALAGHSVTAIRDIAADDFDLVIVTNPNSPDGRIAAKAELVALAAALRRHDGMLVVDEAFMDVGPPAAVLAAETARGNVIVLRSFGKFFGLAGIRLGFAILPPRMAARLSAKLGPWAVSGPAVAIGTRALADSPWIARTRRRLAKSALRLDAILHASDLEIVGGTDLFRLVRTPAATALFHHLGRAGILARIFPERSDWLRFGLPANEQSFRRLQIAMAAFQISR